MVPSTVFLKRRTQYLNVDGSPQLIYKCNAIPIKNPNKITLGTREALSKIHLEQKIREKSQNFLNKDNDGELALTDSSRNRLRE